MPTVTGIFFTSNGIVVANGSAAVNAFTERMATSISSGEVSGVVVDLANKAAPIVDGYTDAQFVTDMERAANNQDWNAMTREAFAEVMGFLAGTNQRGQRHLVFWLGRDSDERAATYRDLFRPQLDAEAAEDIHEASQLGMPDGEDRFLKREMSLPPLAADRNKVHLRVVLSAKQSS